MRAAIINAARTVARRQGVLEMTLSTVASEARVAAGDVYAFFTSKNDLLQAVVADDLAALAKTMRRSMDPQPAAADEAAVAKTPQQDTQVPPMPAAESPQDDPQNEKSGALETPASPVHDRPRRFPVVQARREPSRSPTADAEANAKAHAATADAVARLEEAVKKLQSYPVDQWLERRLREFERTLYGLKHNQNHRTSSNAFQLGLQSLRESVEALERRHTVAADDSARAIGDRLDALDERLREALSEIQTESAPLARRITALENLAFASRPEPLAPLPVEAFAPVEETPLVAEPVEPKTDPTRRGAENGTPPESTAYMNDEPLPSYLATARRSAQAAAEHAGEDLRHRPVAPRQNKTFLYASCGALALFVVLLAGAGFVMRDANMNAPLGHAASRSASARGAHAVVAKPLQRAAQMAAKANLLKLAQTGDASAELLVGLEYLEGKGEPKNAAIAVDWLSRAAAKGQPVAQYDLGALYADGRGVQADPVQAFQWFGSAALRGNRRAMHFLAISYAEGVGTTKDLPQAARWFERAASLGAVNSAFNVAVLYERGMGVPQSLTTAYKWYAIAAAQGDHESQARVAVLASTLKPDDLASAKAAAETFRPAPLDPAANLPPKLPS